MGRWMEKPRKDVDKARKKLEEEVRGRMYEYLHQIDQTDLSSRFELLATLSKQKYMWKATFSREPFRTSGEGRCCWEGYSIIATRNGDEWHITLGYHANGTVTLKKGEVYVAFPEIHEGLKDHASDLFTKITAAISAAVLTA